MVSLNLCMEPQQFAQQLLNHKTLLFFFFDFLVPHLVRHVIRSGDKKIAAGYCTLGFDAYCSEFSAPWAKRAWTGAGPRALISASPRFKIEGPGERRLHWHRAVELADDADGVTS